MADTKEDRPPAAVCLEANTGSNEKCKALALCTCFDGHKGKHHDRWGQSIGVNL